MSFPAAAAPPVILKRGEASYIAKDRRSFRSNREPKTYDVPPEEAKKWWPKREPRANCTGPWTVAFCSKQAKARKIGCHRKSCRACRTYLRKRAAERIRRKLDHGRDGRPLIYVVPTVPPELRHIAAIKRRFHNWKRQLILWMKAHLGFDFGIERTDPAGQCKASKEDDDFCPCLHCAKWHPHLNILWVPKPDSPCANGMIPPELLEALKAEWQRIIGAERKVSMKVLNSRWNFKKHRPATREEEEDKVDKWCSYMGRTWPDWQSVVRGHIFPRWYGRRVKVQKPAAEHPKCDCCGEELSFIECELGQEEAEFWESMGPERCKDELLARVNLDTGHIGYRPVPQSLLREPES